MTTASSTPPAATGRGDPHVAVLGDEDEITREAKELARAQNAA